MLSLPQILERREQPYIAIRQTVTLPFNAAVDRAFSALQRWRSEHAIEFSGSPFFKYNRVAMPELEIEFGFPTKDRVSGDDRVTSGVLPAGRYASVSYEGPYSDLMEVNAVLIGWAEHKQLHWDARESPDGDLFACRIEIYETDPTTEPDPRKYRTTVAIRLAD